MLKAIGIRKSVRNQGARGKHYLGKSADRKVQWKALRLDLLGVRSKDWSLTTEALPVDGVVCLQSKHLRSIPGMIAPPAKIYARDRSRSRWNMKHFRQTARAVAWSHSAAHCMHCIWLGCENKGKCMDWSWPVTMHDDQGPVEKEGRHGGPLKLLTWPFGRWTIDSSLPQSSACFGGCSLNTGERKLKNGKFFGGVVGLDGRCSAQAEQRKKRVAVGPLPGAYLSTETNLVPIRGVIKKEFDTGQTDRQTHRHTHGIKAPWTARSPALARTWHPARMASIHLFSRESKWGTLQSAGNPRCAVPAEIHSICTDRPRPGPAASLQVSPTSDTSQSVAILMNRPH